MIETLKSELMDSKLILIDFDRLPIIEDRTIVSRREK